MPSFEGNLITQRHQIILLETRYPRLPHGENPDSLSHLCLIRYRVVTLQTDGRTDRQTDGQNSHSYTHSQQYLPVHLSPIMLYRRGIFPFPEQIHRCHDLLEQLAV